MNHGGKMSYIWIISLILLLAIPVLQVIKAKMKTFEAESDLLMEKWKLARDRRRGWKEDHRFSFNFNNSEYQTLWDLEIGSEYIYLLHLSDAGIKGDNISWADYCIEKRQAEEENEWS